MLSSKLTTKLKHRVLAWQKSHLGGFATLKQQRHSERRPSHTLGLRTTRYAISWMLRCYSTLEAPLAPLSLKLEVKGMKINQMTFQHCPKKWVFLPFIKFPLCAKSRKIDDPKPLKGVWRLFTLGFNTRYFWPFPVPWILIFKPLDNCQLLTNKNCFMKWNLI